jgi:DNA-binding LacI/PurR family transcriptional regulator
LKVTRPTSLDIARIAQVSPATVSRALRDSPLVAAETRERIKEIARELNYRIDRSAAGLRTRRSRTIALLIFDDSPEDGQINPFFLSMLGHITRAAARQDLDLLVSFQQLSADWYTDYELSNRAEGMILLGYGDYLTAEVRLRRLAESGAHFVIWGPQLKGLPGHYLACDNVLGGRLATEHLLGLGRRRIAFVGSVSDQWPEFKQRFEGYSLALREAGLALSRGLQVPAQSLDSAGYAAGITLLSSGEPFDAVFAASDLIAIGLMRALSERGVAVPEEVAVVGFDDISIASYVDPPLTTVRQDTVEVSRMLVDRLVELIEGDEIESGLVAPRLIVRRSCGG